MEEASVLESQRGGSSIEAGGPRLSARPQRQHQERPLENS